MLLMNMEVSQEFDVCHSHSYIVLLGLTSSSLNFQCALVLQIYTFK